MTRGQCESLTLSLYWTSTNYTTPVLTGAFDAVGTPVTGRPPHRSQHAELPHWAPASGQTRRHCSGISLCYNLPYPAQHTLQVCPTLCSEPVSLDRVSLGQPPSLHFLRRPWRTTAIVRKLLWYYEAVRLPTSVHRRRAPSGFTARTTVPTAVVKRGISRFPCVALRCAHGVSDRAGS